MDLLQLTKQNFDQAIEQNDFLIIEFSAPWCAPCASLAKLCAELANTMPDVRFASINIDEEKELAKEFAVSSLPLVWVMRERTILHAITGLVTKQELVKLIDSARECDLEKSN